MNDGTGEAKSDAEQAIESHVKPEGNDSGYSSVDLSSDITWISNKILSQSLQSSAPEEMVKQQSSNNEFNGQENEAFIKENVLNGGPVVQVKPNSVQGVSTSAEGTLAHPDHQTDEVDFVLSSKQDGDNASSATEENFAFISNSSNVDRLKQGKSVRSLVDSSRSNGPVRSNRFVVADAHSQSRSSISESKGAKTCEKEINKPFFDGRIQNLEHRMKALEEELREAAAIEVSLYSVVAEHGSSMTKVHAPARRLSRLYFHASKLNSKSRRGGAAKSIVSGLVLVSKACGNDVPRYNYSHLPSSKVCLCLVWLVVATLTLSSTFSSFFAV